MNVALQKARVAFQGEPGAFSEAAARRVDRDAQLVPCKSFEEVFDTVPGTLWDLECGLDDRQYIVPGGGGFGELMNNAYV